LHGVDGSDSDSSAVYEFTNEVVHVRCAGWCKVCKKRGSKTLFSLRSTGRTVPVTGAQMQTKKPESANEKVKRSSTDMFTLKMRARARFKEFLLQQDYRVGYVGMRVGESSFVDEKQVVMESTSYVEKQAVKKEKNVEPQASVSWSMSIPPNAIGAVIGKRGSVIKSLEAMEGVSRVLLQKDPVKSTYKVLEVTGNTSAVVHVLSKVEGIVKSTNGMK